MSGVGVTILAVAIVMVVFSSRVWAAIGLMVGVLYLTQGQKVEVLSFNLYAIRLVALAGFARVMFRREFSFRNLVAVDKALMILYGYTTVVFVIRSSEDQASIIGGAVDAFLCYFCCRGLIKGPEEFRLFLRRFLLLLVPYTGFVITESLTQYNVFSSQGGIEYGSWVREGRPRCQGSFRHAALLGAFAAAFLPIYIAEWMAKSRRTPASIGIGCCVLIVWASNSGGPASCAAVGIAGWLLWRMRRKMKWIRQGALVAFVGLALVMNAPVWYLLTRVSSVSGGTGWHRARLMDMATQHIDQWWFAGMPVQDTKDWFPYVLSITGGADITNQYVFFGITAGIIGVCLFLVLLYLAFKQIGRALQVSRTTPRSRSGELLFWGMGTMLLVHCVAWLGNTYFDQMYVVWFFHLAVVVSLVEFELRHGKVGDRALGQEGRAWSPHSANARYEAHSTSVAC